MTAALRDDGALLLMFIDDMGIVNNVIEDIDGRAIKGLLHALDGALDAGAEAAWLGYNDLHFLLL